jgi:hypothetical protein
MQETGNGIALRLLGRTAPNGIECARMSSLKFSIEGDRPWNRLSELGMDTSKSAFQLHGVNASEQPVLRKKAVTERNGEVLRENAADHCCA